MLYVTTRNSRDAYTAHRVLQDRRGPDGGFFVPFRIPVFSESEIEALAGKSFNSCVADVLNLLFSAQLTGYDLDFCIGRRSVRMEMLNQRILMVECWHNPQWEFSKLVDILTGMLCRDKEKPEEPGDWMEIGVRIAVLFGIFGELMRQGIAAKDKPVDVSVVSGDFSAPMSAWYARTMGLPIGNIVCSCNENGNLWDFICHGHLRTDSVAVKTCVPEADVSFPAGLERLLYSFGGTEEAERFVAAVRQGRTYFAEDKFLHPMRQGIYATVVSQTRVLNTIPSVFATHRYVLGPGTALAYAGLQDYRARTGASRCAIVLSEKSPRLDSNIVMDTLGISQQQFERLL